MVEVGADCIHDFDVIVDVRSPSEFAHSHIPNAINLFVLDDAQHHIVGEQYRHDPFGARILGASFVCANMAQHLKNFRQTFHPSQKILVYCARGGQRSFSFAVIVDSIGYRVARLSGGFKAYRNHVCRFFEKPLATRLAVLYGLTGSGKTEIVRNCKVGIDIEGIAGHRGSSFGGFGCVQPSGKMFQNLLFEAFAAKKVALVEGESKRIGNLVLPSVLTEQMRKGLKIEIITPFEARLQRIVAEYGKIDLDFFTQSMDKIKPYMQRSAWQQCKTHFQNGAIAACVEILLVEYYDKVYRQVACDVRINHQTMHQTIQSIEQLLQSEYQNDTT